MHEKEASCCCVHRAAGRRTRVHAQTSGGLKRIPEKSNSRKDPDYDQILSLTTNIVNK